MVLMPLRPYADARRARRDQTARHGGSRSADALRESVARRGDHASGVGVARNENRKSSERHNRGEHGNDTGKSAIHFTILLVCVGDAFTQDLSLNNSEEVFDLGIDQDQNQDQKRKKRSRQWT